MTTYYYRIVVFLTIFSWRMLLARAENEFWIRMRSKAGFQHIFIVSFEMTSIYSIGVISRQHIVCLKHSFKKPKVLSTVKITSKFKKTWK